MIWKRSCLRDARATVRCPSIFAAETTVRRERA
jgi:hypothetical protein